MDVRGKMIERVGTALLPLLLLASGCDRGEETGAAEQGGQAAAQAEIAPAPLEAEARRALEAAIGDLDGFALLDLRRGSVDSICGRLLTPDGRDLPFLVTPDQAAMVAEEAEIRYEDPGDRFAGYYLALCATPEDKEAAAAALEAAITAEEAAQANAFEAAPPLYLELDPELELIPSPPAAPPPPPAARPRNPRPGPPPDSFNDAVVRPSEPAAE